MIAAANHVAVPFFEQLPPQAVPAVCRAWNEITLERNIACDSVFLRFCIDLDRIKCRKPGKAEFGQWFRGVRTGAIPYPADADGSVEIAGQIAVEDTERVMQACSVLAAGNALAQAKLAAGYSPECVFPPDDIICEVIKDLLTFISETGEQPRYAPHDRSPMMVALDLIEPFTPETHERLLDAIVYEFGPELLSALATTLAPSPGAAA